MNKFIFLSAAFVALLSTPVWAQPPQVEFVGTIASVDIGDGINGTLTVGVTAEVELTIHVNELTEIRKEGEPATLADLEAGDIARIGALFADDGFLALEVDVVEAAAAFILKGFIEDINGAEREIAVAGLPVAVAEDAAIIVNGEEAVFEDLEIGQRARLSGRVDEGDITAGRVRVFGPRDALARVRFQGVVTHIEESLIDVQIAGLATATPVILTEDTEVSGDLTVGALVRISGHLTPELLVVANRIQVLSLVQLAPSRLRLRVGQTHGVRIILRAERDVPFEFALSSDDPTIAAPTSDTASLEPGEQTTSFEVNGVAIGETTIVVTLPAALGGGFVELPVDVREAGDDTPPALGFWTPPVLKMKPGEERRARLRLRKVADGKQIIPLAVVKGPGDLVGFPSEVTIPGGRRTVRVIFMAGNATGEVTVRATLPGGKTADIQVEVKDEPDDSSS